MLKKKKKIKRQVIGTKFMTVVPPFGGLRVFKV